MGHGQMDTERKRGREMKEGGTQTYGLDWNENEKKKRMERKKRVKEKGKRQNGEGKGEEKNDIGFTYVHSCIYGE